MTSGPGLLLPHLDTRLCWALGKTTRRVNGRANPGVRRVWRRRVIARFHDGECPMLGNTTDMEKGYDLGDICEVLIIWEVGGVFLEASWRI